MTKYSKSSCTNSSNPMAVELLPLPSSMTTAMTMNHKIWLKYIQMLQVIMLTTSITAQFSCDVCFTRYFFLNFSSLFAQTFPLQFFIEKFELLYHFQAIYAKNAQCISNEMKLHILCEKVLIIFARNSFCISPHMIFFLNKWISYSISVFEK